MRAFSVRQQVMFHHCDPAGIVFYPRYFEMINAAVEMWFEQRLGVSFAALHGERNGAVPTVSLQADFQNASRHGDLLDMAIIPTKLGRSSLVISIGVMCGEEHRLTMEAKLVYMNQETGRAEPWPDDLRQQLSKEHDEVVTAHA